MSKVFLYIVFSILVFLAIVFNPLDAKEYKPIVINMSYCLDKFRYSRGFCYKVVRYVARLDYVENIERKVDRCIEAKTLIEDFGSLPVPDENNLRPYDYLYVDLFDRTEALKKYIKRSCKGY